MVKFPNQFSFNAIITIISVLLSSDLRIRNQGLIYFNPFTTVAYHNLPLNISTLTVLPTVIQINCHFNISGIIEQRYRLVTIRIQEFPKRKYIIILSHQRYQIYLINQDKKSLITCSQAVVMASNSESSNPIH